jgi:fibronectin type 3 domain-containing protein
MKSIKLLTGIFCILLVLGIGLFLAGCEDDFEEVPYSPDFVYAFTVSENSIEISWDSVRNAEGYYIYRSTNADGPYKKVDSTKSTSYIDTGLDSNTTYYYKVSAYNKAGESEKSNYDYTTTKLDIPGIPKNVSATANKSTGIFPSISVTIRWSSVSDATGYRIYYSSSAEDNYNLLIETSSISYTKTGLTPETTYYYKVSAYNSIGESELSEYVSVTTLMSRPNTPTNVKAVAESSSSINITWSSVANADEFKIYRSITSSNFEYIESTTETSFTDTDLKPGTIYYYRISACNSGGESEQTISVSTRTFYVKPAIPGNITASASYLSSIIVEWESVDNATTYKIFRSSNIDGIYEQIGSTVSLSYRDTNNDKGLQKDTTYYYRVTAGNSAGESEQSDYAFAATHSIIEGSSPLNTIELIYGSSEYLYYFPDGLEEVWFEFTRNGSGRLYAEDKLHLSKYTSDIVVDVLIFSLYPEPGFYYVTLGNPGNQIVLKEIDIGGGRYDSNTIYVNNWSGTYYVVVYPKQELPGNKGTFLLRLSP